MRINTSPNPASNLFMPSPLVLTRSSFSPLHGNDERIVKKTSREIKSLDFGWFSLFSLSTQLRLSFESVTGDTGAWVTVMGEVIT